MTSELKMLFKILGDGYNFEIGLDKDGYECIEIQYFEGLKKEARNRMIFNKEDAENLYKALGKLLNKQ